MAKSSMIQINIGGRQPGKPPELWSEFSAAEKESGYQGLIIYNEYKETLKGFPWQMALFLN